MHILLVVIVIAGAIAVALIKAAWERRRREAFRSMAKSLGLTYVSRDPLVSRYYDFIDKLRQGENRYAFNILKGTYKEREVCAFDYHYETHSYDSKGHRTTHDYYLSVVLLVQEGFFPELRIYPEGLLSKLGQMIGFDDIDFESAEFSRKFTVRSPDRKFAYDICHPRMMEYLLRDPKLCLEIEGQVIATTFDQRLNPEDVPRRLEQLFDIHSLFPKYLYRA
jgi:hypothetical protein